MTPIASPIRYVPRSAATWRDPYPMYAALRDRDPCHRVRHDDPAADYWVLSRYEDVAAALKRPALFSSRRGVTFTYGDIETSGMDENLPLVMLDPPEHTDLRRLVTKGFSDRL